MHPYFQQGITRFFHTEEQYLGFKAYISHIVVNLLSFKLYDIEKDSLCLNI